MAIKYDKAYNAEIRRDVHNFNQKRNRAIKRGFRNLPPPMKVSELKSRYDKRTDLNRELKLLKKFNKEDALETIETSGGVKAIKWELEYLKGNLKAAKKFYDREIYRMSVLDTDLTVMKRELLNNYKTKRSLLELELINLDPTQYAAYKATINEFQDYKLQQQSSYRGWMNEVESIMKRLGYDESTINKFFEGFEKLTPSQFVTMYRQSNLISRIYELYIPSRKGKGDFKLSTSEEDARDLIETFMEEKDEMITRARQHEEMLDSKELDAFVKDLNKKELSKKRQPLRKSRKDITEQDIEMIEALGGTIEDLLK